MTGLPSGVTSTLRTMSPPPGIAQLWNFSLAGSKRTMVFGLAPGAVLGIKQAHVSALMRNRAGNFSVGRLMEFLTALGQDVRITVKPTRKEQGEMEVVVG
ncbi:MAG TPA: XRE family transcriptional regulator [Pseudolabrys sp.]|nr:XRE family transcriptional regulator [Pseudolabrys sp.]